MSCDIWMIILSARKNGLKTIRHNAFYVTFIMSVIGILIDILYKYNINVH